MILSTLFVLSNSLLASTDTSLKAGWKIITMDRWTIEVPNKFRDSSLYVFDTYVGMVYSKTDSFYFGYEWQISPDSVYDGGSFMQLGEDNCEFTEQIRRTKEEVKRLLNVWQETFGDSCLYSIQIDTINSRPAIIVFPVMDKTGYVTIKMSNCKPNGFISIWGKNLTIDQKNLFLEIGKTIKFLEF